MAKSKKSDKPDEKIASPEPSPEVRPIPLAPKPKLGLLKAPIRLQDVEMTMSAWDDIFMPKEAAAQELAARDDTQAFFKLMGAVLGVKEKSLRRSAIKMPYGFAIDVEAAGNWPGIYMPRYVEDEQAKTKRLEAEFEVLLANHNRLMDHFK